jgi:hypothetical protein
MYPKNQQILSKTHDYLRDRDRSTRFLEFFKNKNTKMRENSKRPG